MKKIFVTVGTTKFESLIHYIDNNISSEDFEVVIQKSNGKYIPKNFESFQFTKEIDRYYNECDIVITHAGAGTIYKLLEIKKNIIIIPNIERIDNHQTDIANYMKEEKYAYVANELNDINSILLTINNNNLVPYKKESFFKAKEIIFYSLNK